VFTPALIEVEAKGRRFFELHVDGGVTQNVFIVPDPFLVSRRFLPAHRSGKLYAASAAGDRILKQRFRRRLTVAPSVIVHGSSAKLTSPGDISRSLMRSPASRGY
jgi:hypothetical protein